MSRAQHVLRGIRMASVRSATATAARDRVCMALTSSCQPRTQRSRAMSTLVVKVDNPYTLETYAEVELSSSAEARDIVKRSAKAQKSWKKTTLDERIALCKRFMEEFEKDRPRIAKDITGQMGKPLAYANGEINGMYGRCNAILDLCQGALADEILPEKDNFFRKIVKEPVGVVLCIAPWNYPLLTAINCVFPALLAGNSVVLKHSPRTPLCAEAFVRAFNAAGFPKDVVTALHCENTVVNEVIGLTDVGFVSFTGSVGGGRAVYQTVAATRFIDATLELGGKDPAYVAPDADLPAAIAGLIDGAMFNSGQSCCAVERVYVHKSHYKKFLEGALKEMQGYKLGDPTSDKTNMGPMAQPQQVAFLREQVIDAVAKGARLLIGGDGCTDTTGKGRFFQPTLLADCNHTMNIMVQESFGPVLGVMEVESDEQAIQLMNDSPYGLSAAVYTTSQDRANHFAREVSAGTVFMNRCDFLDPLLPWGGHRNTGKGVSLSAHGFRGVTKLKGYHFKLHANK